MPTRYSYPLICDCNLPGEYCRVIRCLQCKRDYHKMCVGMEMNTVEYDWMCVACNRKLRNVIGDWFAICCVVLCSLLFDDFVTKQSVLLFSMYMLCCWTICSTSAEYCLIIKVVGLIMYRKPYSMYNKYGVTVYRTLPLVY